MPISPLRELIVKPRAEAELQKAAGWYESHRTGLGIEFVHEIDSVFAAIREGPMAYRAVRGPIRRALVARFPYGVFFVESPTTVDVLAIIHTRRDPRRWPSRPAR